jgi:predicted amidohydrolase YtcJ
VLGVKLFLDGVVENGTAHLTEPYGRALDGGRGYYSVEEVSSIIRFAESRGATVHLHAIGDAAVAAALDAIEAARSEAMEPMRPHHPLRHSVAHAQLMRGGDETRAAALGVIFNGTPFWFQNDALMCGAMAPALGEERAARQYPFASLRAAGVDVTFGSDWPVSTFDPLVGLHVRHPPPPLSDPPPPPLGCDASRPRRGAVAAAPRFRF